MAATGGRTPYDQSGALTGPARVVYAPISVTVPASLWDVVSPINVAGEYPLQTGWKDFGLSVDAPAYAHNKEVKGLDYQQPTSTLFEQVSAVTRTFTAQIAEISPDNLIIIENTQQANQAVAAAANKSAQTKVPFGLYDEFQTYRIVMISFRPSGSAIVTEPDGTVRPPAVGLILPSCRLSASSADLKFERGTPVNASVEFTVFKEPTLPAGSEHGYWDFETPGVIAAV